MSANDFGPDRVPLYRPGYHEVVYAVLSALDARRVAENANVPANVIEAEWRAARACARRLENPWVLVRWR